MALMTYTQFWAEADLDELYSLSFIKAPAFI